MPAICKFGATDVGETPDAETTRLTRITPRNPQLHRRPGGIVLITLQKRQLKRRYGRYIHESTGGDAEILHTYICTISRHILIRGKNQNINPRKGIVINLGFSAFDPCCSDCFDI